MGFEPKAPGCLGQAQETTKPASPLDPARGYLQQKPLLRARCCCFPEVVSSKPLITSSGKDHLGPCRLSILPLPTHRHSRSLFIQVTGENAQQDKAEGSFVQMFGSNVLERGSPLESALQGGTHPVWTLEYH